MDCPGCHYSETRVLESRPDTHEGIRRRRQCMKCQLRFSTEEHVKEAKKKKEVK
jgi:transcriptional repressor NrdR